MAELVAIVNSLDRSELLRGALTNLGQVLAELPCATAIVVFDAGSTDGSREWLRQQSGIKLIVPELSAGNSFAHGINAACAQAVCEHADARWLLFFETDNAMKSAGPLVQGMEWLRQRAEWAGIGFTVRMRDGAPGGCAARFPTWLQLMVGPQLVHKLAWDVPAQARGQKVWECEVVYTSPLLVRKEAWLASGGMDAEQFPFSESDVDWCWRLHRLGWRFAVLETAEVIHDNAGTLSAWSRTRLQRWHAARVALLRRYRGDWLWLILPGLWVRHGLECLAAAWMEIMGKRKGLWQRQVDILVGAASGYRAKRSGP